MEKGREWQMRLFECILLLCLVVCALSVAFTKDLLTSIIIFMSYSLIMCLIWMILQSPDLAITEAAVGAGVTSILFFLTLKKIRAIRKEGQDEQEEG
jgi:energy-converting hydrogenase B subunit D